MSLTNIEQNHKWTVHNCVVNCDRWKVESDPWRRRRRVIIRFARWWDYSGRFGCCPFWCIDAGYIGMMLTCVVNLSLWKQGFSFDHIQKWRRRAKEGTNRICIEMCKSRVIKTLLGLGHTEETWKYQVKIRDGHYWERETNLDMWVSQKSYKVEAFMISPEQVQPQNNK